MEYCTGGNLLELLAQDTILPEYCISSFGVDIANALGYIHSRGVLYCDLKPSNILFDDAGTLKLCDFGLARLIPGSKSSQQVRNPHFFTFFFFFFFFFSFSNFEMNS